MRYISIFNQNCPYRLLYSLDDWLDDVLVPPPEGGDERGEYLTHVGDDREGEGDADDGEQDAEHAAGRRHGGDVAVAWNPGRKLLTAITCCLSRDWSKLIINVFEALEARVCSNFKYEAPKVNLNL